MLVGETITNAQADEHGGDVAMPARVSLMGIPIDPWTMTQTVECACRYVERGEFAHFVGINADKVLQMRDEPVLDATVRRCEVVNADGASILFAAQRLGVWIPERVTGIDLLYRLCEMAQRESYRVFLLGAKQEVVEKACDQLCASYPRLDIVGARNGYFGRDKYASVAGEVASAAPDIVFVGITSPKKEEVIEFFRSQNMRGVFVGVGGSFDVVSGNLARAPRWMQASGLEWLFRMIQEPGRLLRRYVMGNTRFLKLVFAEKRLQKRCERAARHERAHL